MVFIVMAMLELFDLDTGLCNLIPSTLYMGISCFEFVTVTFDL